MPLLCDFLGAPEWPRYGTGCWITWTFLGLLFFIGFGSQINLVLWWQLQYHVMLECLEYLFSQWDFIKHELLCSCSAEFTASQIARSVLPLCPQRLCDSSNTLSQLCSKYYWNRHLYLPISVWARNKVISSSLKQSVPLHITFCVIGNDFLILLTWLKDPLVCKHELHKTHNKYNLHV